MLAFPRMPEWEVDELAGSYFSFLARENSVSSRFSFLRWLGFERNYCNAQIMDIGELTPTWIALADKLEIGLDTMIRQLSTKPYWACFYKQDHLAAPELRALTKLPVDMELLLSVSHTRLQLRICTECLATDCQSTRGGAILRRSHQLPGSLVCHTHGVTLIHRCPGCGNLLVPRLGFVDVALKCESCGRDLRTHREQSLDGSSSFLDLARFEHECLCSTAVPRPTSEVAAFITKVLQERGVSALELLAANFGVEMNSWRRSLGPEVPKRLNLWRETMPTLCACLVALGFTHESAQKAIGHSIPQDSTASEQIGRIKSISQARKIILARIRSGENVTWSSLRGGSQNLFWFFVLNDQAWLEKKVGRRSGSMLRIPSVAEDRQGILGSYSDHQRWEAYARASCRDLEWLDSELSHRKEERSKERTLDRDAGLRASTGEAMTAWYAKPGRPIKFTLERAAASVGTNMANIQSLNRRDPQPRDTLFESTNHYRRRLLMWTMDELAQQDALVTPNRLLRLARVAVGPMERFWAASIVHLFGPKEP